MFDGEHAEKQDRGILSSILSFVISLIVITVLYLFLHFFVIEAYTIPSGSMEETIMTGDSVLGEKVSFNFRSPAKGDIVTFTDPEQDTRLLIKRVVATAGQSVDFVGGKLVVDGVEQEESYTLSKLSEPLPNSIAIRTYPYTVPEGCVFVMGDNRTNSQDSRYFGSIDISTIKSRAVLIYWPFEHFKLF